MIICTNKTKKGVDVLFKTPEKSDAKRLCSYANFLAEEKDFLLFHGKKVSLQEEKVWLSNAIYEMKKYKAVYLLAIVENEIVGFGGIKLKSQLNSHVGELGVSIAKKFRNDGIGSELSSVLITEGKKRMKELRIIFTTTFEVNTLAKKMYKRLGFKRFGCLPEGVNHKGVYIGLLYFYKKILSGYVK